MQTIFLLTVVVVTAVLGLVLIYMPSKKQSSEPVKPKPNTQGKWPYKPKLAMTNAERILYHRLIAAMPNHIILAKVHLPSILDISDEEDHQFWLNRISHKRVDFLVCYKDGSVVAVIELENEACDDGDKKNVDHKREKALQDAGVRVVKWNVKDIPAKEDILSEFTESKFFKDEWVDSYRK